MKRFVVVGGGIAGVCCTEELCRLCPDSLITVINPDATLRGVGNVVKITKNVEEFEVVSKDLAALPHPNLRLLRGTAASVDTTARQVHLQDGTAVPYDTLCIATGATPKRVTDGPHVIVLRDSDTVAGLVGRLAGARRVLVAGNGGIALELVHALRGVDVVWAVKHGHIGDAYFDTDAASFLMTELQPHLAPSGPPAGSPVSPLLAPAGNGADGLLSPVESPDAQPHSLEADTSLHSTASGASASASAASDAPGNLVGAQASSLARSSSMTCYSVHKGHPPTEFGHAVGPRWQTALDSGAARGTISLEQGCHIEGVIDTSAAPASARGGSSWPVYVQLSNGKVVGVDFVISATGVTPNTGWLPAELARDPQDGGLLVDRCLQTSNPHIYAAGDACSVPREQQAPHWFQMRLWTQARVMGTYASHCMAGVADELGSDFNFELFTHVTRFCGRKVVLLGLYNGQKLEDEPASDIVTYARTIEDPDNPTFVRVLLLRGRMQGAVLIGETELEETFENLVLDQLDLSAFGPQLLDPEAELDHMFD